MSSEDIDHHLNYDFFDCDCPECQRKRENHIKQLAEVVE